MFIVRKVEIFGQFEYFIDPPKVRMPQIVEASPILFDVQFMIYPKEDPKDLVSTWNIFPFSME